MALRNWLEGRIAPYLLLTGLCLALYLPGVVTIPPVDRDEPRYAQATKQMVETGDYVSIRFLDQARNKKPIGIHWLQAAVVRITGQKDVIWPYRVPSVIGGTLAVLFTLAAGRVLFPPVAAFAGAVFLAVSPMLITVTHAGATDAVLLATVVAAQWGLARVYQLGTAGQPVPWRITLLFWVAQGCGILVKGPITPAVSLMSFLLLSRKERNVRWARGLRPTVGLPLALLMALPWFVAVQLATSGEYLRESLGEDFIPKLDSIQQGHGSIPGAYTLTAVFTLWPVILFVWGGLCAAWTQRSRREYAYCLAWGIPLWLILELVPTKLPHYALPCYPALCLLAGAALFGAPAPLAAWGWPWLRRLLVAVWVLVGMGLAAAMPLVGWFLDAKLYPVACVSAVAAVLGTVAIGWFARTAQPGRAAIAAATFAVLYFVPAFGWFFPQLDNLWVSRKIARMVTDYERQTGTHVVVAATGYEEPSLGFALGSDTGLERTPKDVVEALRSKPGTVALVQDYAEPVVALPVPAPWATALQHGLTLKESRRLEGKFLAAAAAAGIDVKRVAQVEGFNHSKGKRVRVILYVRGSSTGGEGVP